MSRIHDVNTFFITSTLLRMLIHLRGIGSDLSEMVIPDFTTVLSILDCSLRRNEWGFCKNV